MTRRIIEFLGLRRSIVGMLGMVVLVGMGERMAERFLPIYLMALGGTELVLGLFGGLTNLLGALYSLPGGYLSDRIGVKRSLLLFNGIAMAGYVLVILVPKWQAVIFGAVLFLCWSAVSLPATMDLVAKVLPKTKRTMGVSVLAIVRRIPMALGPVVGGVCIDLWGKQRGVQIAFVGALAMGVIAMVVQQVLIEEDRSKKQERLQAPWKLMRVMSPSLRDLLVSDILIRFCEQIPYVFVVVWCMERIAAPVSATQFGALTAVEMATAVLVYIPVAYLADKGGKKPFVAMTFVFFTLFPLVLLFCQSFWLLVGAFVLRGLKEFGEAARKALIMDLAPEGRKATMFGLYYLVRDTVVSLAAFGGAFLWKVSPTTNLLAAFGFGVLGTLWFILRGRDLSAEADVGPIS